MSVMSLSKIIESAKEVLEIEANSILKMKDSIGEEFDKAIWFNIGQNQMWIESSDEMVNFVWNQYLLYWRIRTLDDILEKIKNVKIGEVIDIAKYLQEENLYKYWIE